MAQLAQTYIRIGQLSLVLVYSYSTEHFFATNRSEKSLSNASRILFFLFYKSWRLSEKISCIPIKKFHVKTQVQSVEKECQTATALHTICHVYCILLRV